MSREEAEFEKNTYYGTKQIQDYCNEILRDINEFCISHDIKYSLSGGSLLGAIRHKGFIPWDDDVDIMFDRENYDKLISLSGELPKTLVIIQNIWVKRITKTDNIFADKEIGCIDLFVFDNVPNSKMLARIKVFLIQLLQGMLKAEIEYDNYAFIYRVLIFVTWLMGIPFSKKSKQLMYDKVQRIGNNEPSDFINCYNTFFYQSSAFRFPKSMMKEYLMVPFEGKMFMAIQESDLYLKTLYGDYMQLPSEEERKPKHDLSMLNIRI